MLYCAQSRFLLNESFTILNEFVQLEIAFIMLGEACRTCSEMTYDLLYILFHFEKFFSNTVGTNVTEIAVIAVFLARFHAGVLVFSIY